MFYVVYLIDARVYLVIPINWLRDGSTRILEKFVDYGLNSNQKHICFWSPNIEAVASFNRGIRMEFPCEDEIGANYYCFVLKFKTQRRDAEIFMSIRRNYMPPVYNTRRVFEAPLPNLQTGEYLELDADIENAIQAVIEINAAEMENGVQYGDDVGIADLGIAPPLQINDAAENGHFEIENGVERIENGRDGAGAGDGGHAPQIPVELIKIEPQVHVLDEADHKVLDLILCDEVDPLEGLEIRNDADETATATEPNQNGIELPSCSGFHLRASQNSVQNRVQNPSDSDDSESESGRVTPNAVYINDRASSNVPQNAQTNSSDDDSDIEIIGEIPIAKMEPNYNLIKRQDDVLSGNMPYRDEPATGDRVYLVGVDLVMVPNRVIKQFIRWNTNPFCATAEFDRKVVHILMYICRELIRYSVSRGVVQFTRDFLAVRVKGDANRMSKLQEYMNEFTKDPKNYE